MFWRKNLSGAPSSYWTGRVRRSSLTAVILISVWFAAFPVWSQDNARITGTVFTNPGARSIGLGGAFVAIADDATAAFANPAGLVQILRPELSAELRFTAAHAEDDIPSDLDDSLSGLGFFSFVYPSQKWAVALYSHQVASVGFAFVYPYVLEREFSVRSYAAAGAFQVSEQLSIGLGLSYFDGDRSAAGAVRGFSDADWGINAGLLWSPSRTWKFAGFYRQGPEFESRAPSARFSIADEYGLGCAFQPKAGALTVGFEWDRVGSAVDPLVDGNTTTGGGSEYHLGIEYAVLRWKPVPVLRLGLWREPGRQHDVTIGSTVHKSFESEDRTHMAFGIGLAFKRFQIDGGVDLTGQDIIASLSVVYSF
jgi:hypothetical protein